jgi:hypothetical protein
MSRKLLRENENGSAIYAGANPRRATGGTTSNDVVYARCLFADFDNIDVDGARGRWQAAGLPEPTLTINSGHGIHTYWRLTEPISNMDQWRQLQQRLIATVDSDPAIHDPARIMRLPGLMNHKEPAAMCSIIEADPARRYGLAALAGRLKVLKGKSLGQDPSSGQLQTTEPNKASGLDIVGRANLAAAKWPSVAKGERDKEAYRHGAYLVRDFGLSEAQALPILLAWNETNTPPLPEPELRKCLRNGNTYGQHPIGTKVATGKKATVESEQWEPPIPLGQFNLPLSQ